VCRVSCVWWFQSEVAEVSSSVNVPIVSVSQAEIEMVRRHLHEVRFWMQPLSGTASLMCAIPGLREPQQRAVPETGRFYLAGAGGTAGSG
jgi:hypothetical protein